MKVTFPLALLFALAWLNAGAAPLLRAAETKVPESAASKPATVPPDLNGYRTIVAAPTAPKPVKAAIYLGDGAPKDGVDRVSAEILETIPGSTVKVLTPAEFATADLQEFNLVVFSGGSGSAQGNALGEAGRNHVREYIRGGGGYLGICAGAYLACTKFKWGLGVINASTVSEKWRRGAGFVDMEVTEPGRKIMGDARGLFKVRYHNGPIIQPGDLTDLPAYTPVSLFRSEVAENGTPVGLMTDAPAQAIGVFGKGRVFISSPHAESTPGLENVIPRAVLWASGVDAP